jgi:hypothetical protein
MTPSGGKLWRFKYRYDHNEKKIAFGAYPEISLLDARRKRDDARKLLAPDKRNMRYVFSLCSIHRTR